MRVDPRNSIEVCSAKLLEVAVTLAGYALSIICSYASRMRVSLAGGTNSEGGCGDGADSFVASAGQWRFHLLRLSQLRKVRRRRTRHAGHPADLPSGRNRALPLGVTKTISLPGRHLTREYEIMSLPLPEITR